MQSPENFFITEPGKSLIAGLVSQNVKEYKCAITRPSGFDMAPPQVCYVE